MKRFITSRAQAKRWGLTRYFWPLKACPRGHRAERYTFGYTHNISYLQRSRPELQSVH
jgi:hypothetical protein